MAGDSEFVSDWSVYAEYFRPEEFACSHCGQVKMRRDFMQRLMQIRRAYGRPMRITSGYRCPQHPIEIAKGGKSLGEHSLGACADIACEGDGALLLLTTALAHGITRVGVQQKGSGRFLHLGIGGPGLANPWIWSY